MFVNSENKNSCAAAILGRTRLIKRMIGTSKLKEKCSD
jgi:hypothetical protein